jgi:hypothetical protein
VKDGATAIEALGDSIDASLVDLKGGTTGQVLSKNSNTDMDFVWVTDAAGDITGVTAGTGISGGGTSGTVTITNSMATAIDAKGDLVAGTAADTFSRLAVGANNTVLTADSAEATGLKWATPSASTPTYAGCLVYGSTDQNISNNTFTALTYDSEINDTNTYHSTSSNTSRITIPSGKAGYYQVYANAAFSANASGSRQLFIRKNNTDVIFSAMGGYNNGRNVVFISGTINCAVGDYLEIFAYQESGSTLDVGGGTRNYFGVDYLGV